MEIIAQLGIIPKISAQSQSMGLLVGIEFATLQKFQKQTLNDNDEVCTLVLNNWIVRNGHSDKYPLTWNALYQLLDDIGHKRAAIEMKDGLARQVIKI